MCNPDTEFKQDIADKFKDVTSNLNFNNVSDEKMYSYLATYENAKNEILSLNYTPDEIVDAVIIDLFANRKTPMKKAFWTLFGDVVYQNVCKNIDDSFVQCERCHKRFYQQEENQTICKKCIKQEINLQNRLKREHKKIVICCDCGKEVVTSNKNTMSIRCKKCQDIVNKNKRKICMQKLRSYQKCDNTKK